jgi:hypothetical protein
MDAVTQSQSFTTLRQTLANQLTNLLNSWGIVLPAVNAQGAISQSALNTICTGLATAYPLAWSSAIATQINSLLTQMGYLATALMPLSILGTANASGSTNATVSTAVTFPTALASSSYGVFVDTGQAGTWYITSKSTTGFTVNQVPPSGAAIAAGTFNVLVVN